MTKPECRKLLACVERQRRALIVSPPQDGFVVANLGYRPRIRLGESVLWRTKDEIAPLALNRRAARCYIKHQTSNMRSRGGETDDLLFAFAKHARRRRKS